MRYQYSSFGFKQNYNKNPFLFPNGVKLLLIINILIFSLMVLLGQRDRDLVIQIFGLVPYSISNDYKIWQTFTYLFLHDGPIHIIFNMFLLWVLGKDLEIDWGRNKFLIFYFICGIGAGLITWMININSLRPVVGASGAIYGVLVAYGFTYPNRMIYLYGLIPMKVKYMVTCLVIIAFFASLFSTQSKISHITHLSGIIIGIIYILINSNLGNLHLWYIKMRIRSIQSIQNNNENEETYIKMQVNKILDKLNDQGWESLTSKEEEFLTHASKRLFDDRSPN